MKISRYLLIFFVYMILASNSLFAETWTQTTDADFNAGSVDTLAITGSGVSTSIQIAGYTFSYKREITIDNTAGDLLTGYAVKIMLDGSNFDFAQTQPNGEDIRFLDTDGCTPLQFFIQSWDSAYEVAVIWVSVPLIPAADVHSLWLYYGNTAIGGGSTDIGILDEIQQPVITVGNSQAISQDLFEASGIYTSPAYDTGKFSNFITLTWGVDLPAGTSLRFRVRSADTEASLSSATWYGPTGPADYYTISGTAINAISSPNRWVQFMAYLKTSDITVTPSLSSVSIDYESYDVVISTNTVWVEGQYHLANLTVQNAASLTIGGGSTLTVDDNITVTENSGIILQSKNRDGQVDEHWVGEGVVINAANIVVDTGCYLSADGYGYVTGLGPGGGTGENVGGTYGGRGENNNVAPYGWVLEPADLGSGGGAYGPLGGWSVGGGAIRLNISDTFILDGLVTASGLNSATSSAGGAGGSIWVNTHILTGSGVFHADGSAGSAGSYGDGGGGRVAVYYEIDDGFGGFTQSTASAGGSGATDGTIAFFDTSASANHIKIFRYFELPPDTEISFGAMTIDNAAMFIIGGGSTLTVEESLTVRGNSGMILQSKNRDSQVNWQWVGEGVTINAANIVIAEGSFLSADGYGYLTAMGPGGATSNVVGGTHGGGYIYNVYTAYDDATYGSALEPVDLGSGGGAYYYYGGWSVGGGAIRLNISDTFILDGLVTASGLNSATSSAGGAGGSIWVNTHILTGSGVFHADGSAGSAGSYGDGGGGRVAVYYEIDDGFGGFTQSTASAGGSGATDGTIAFFDTSIIGSHAKIYRRFELPGDMEMTFGALSITNGAEMTIGGGSRIQVNGTITVDDNSGIIIAGKNREARIEGEWMGQGAAILASHLNIGEGAYVSAEGRGYTTGNGPGGPPHVTAWYVGGTYGGKGSGQSAELYGDADFPMDLGSAGGGAGGDEWSAGGGAIFLNISGTLHLDGEITANGLSSGDMGYHSGGSGGSICIAARTIEGVGRITADGHMGYQNVAGGGGRIAIYYINGFALPQENITAAAGGPEAGAGTVKISNTPVFKWAGDVKTSGQTKQSAFIALGVDLTVVSSEIYVTDASGVTDQIDSQLNTWGSIDWDAGNAADGVYELSVVFKRGEELLAELTRSVLVNNSAAWHSGWIGSDETWTADQVHIVEADVIIADGATLTIAPGAVVKFYKGTGITVENNGLLDAFATEDFPIIFTSFFDDTAGGDTNLDGGLSISQPGDWTGIEIQGTGQADLNQFVVLRYVKMNHTGSIAQSETWSGTFLHQVDGNITVSSGATLTIEPGAVIKISKYGEMIFEPGTHLVALGDVARPIVFTSIYDDSVGGDTNGDGNATNPDAGDWRWIYINNATASFDHVRVCYGGGTQSGTWESTGAIRTNGDTELTFSNSVIRDAFFDGILDYGGTAVITNSVFTGIDRAVCAHAEGTVNIINCTLDDNRIGLLVHGGTLDAANCIVSNSFESGVQYDNGILQAIRYTDIWAPGGSGSVNYCNTPDQTGIDGNISTDPKYKNRDQGNFRLSYGSPAIDAADGMQAPDTDFMGSPRYSDPRTSTKTGIPAEGGVYADMGAYEFVENAGSDVDLIVSSVTGPTSAVVGEEVTIKWTITNIGTGAAAGPWHDTIYLVRNPDTDPVEIFACEVLVAEGVVLGPGVNYTASANVIVPGSNIGNHQWEVKTNSRGDVFEGVQWDNNTAMTNRPTAIDMNAIPIGGEPVNGQFTSSGDSHWYLIDLQANQDILLSLNSENGSGIEIYAGNGYLPDPTHFDFKSSEFNSSSPSVVLSDSTQSIYYVLIYPRVLLNTPVDFNLKADRLAFGISSVVPGIVGNACPVTLQLKGGQLTPDMTYVLCSAAGECLSATAVYTEDAGVVYATFDISGFSPGMYGLEVKNGTCQNSMLPEALQIVEGTGGRLNANLIVPNVVRVGRQFTVLVAYGNEGDGDLIAPIFYLYSPTASLAYKDYPSVSGEMPMQLIGIANTGPVGILRPGEKGSIRLTATAVSGTMGFTLKSMVADSTPIDWNQEKLSMRPAMISVDAWEAGYNKLAENIGTTWADYQEALAQDATKLGAQGWRTPRVDDALKMELVRASNSLISGTLLDQTTDAPLPNIQLLAYLGEDTGTVKGSAVTDAQGRFSIENLNPGDYTLRSLTCDFDSPPTYTLTEGNDETNVILHARITAICGSVVGPMASLSGLTISAINTETDEAISTVTGEDGSFLFKKVSSGTYTFSVPNAIITQVTPDPTQVAQGETLSGVTLTLDPGVTVSGTVTGAADGKTVSNALIYLLSGQNVAYAGISDANGEYLLGGIADGSYTVAVLADGYGETCYTDMEMFDGAVELDLQLSNPSVLTGMVTYNGQPDDNTYIKVELQGAPGLGMGFAYTDSNGRFRVENLAAGAYNLTVIANTSDTIGHLSNINIPGEQVIDLGTIALTDPEKSLSMARSIDATVIKESPSGDLLPLASDGDVVEWDYLNPMPVPKGLKINECNSEWESPGHPPYTPYIEMTLEQMQEVDKDWIYCYFSWLPFARARFGPSVHSLWQKYLMGMQNDGPTLMYFTDNDDIVKGYLATKGFRNHNVIREIMKQIYSWATTEASRLFEINNVPNCLLIKDLNNGEVSQPIENLIPEKRSDLICMPAHQKPDIWNFRTIFDIPGNIAGGTGCSDLYPDDRHVSGDVLIKRTGAYEITLSFDLTVTVLDAVDFSPGNPGDKWLERKFTIPMKNCEDHNDAYDAVFQVQWHEKHIERIPINFSELEKYCPPPEQKPPPTPDIPKKESRDRKGTTSVGSVDPNEKLTVGYGDQGFITGDMTIYYTIYFENQSSATAPAAKVVVTDQLDANLDWSTVQLISAGFNNTDINIPENSQMYSGYTTVATDPNPVHVHAALDPTTGIITWTMESIDPVTGGLPEDPFAGFLPPDDETGCGDGYVMFSVKPRPGLADETAIKNQAAIIFDVNAPIITNTVTNTIDNTDPSSAVVSLPENSEKTSFTVSWNGNDSSGAGVAHYDIYSSTDSGDFLPWLMGTTDTSATFTGTAGHRYAFYCVATDNAGNQQATSATAQATTDVNYGDINNDGTIDLADAVLCLQILSGIATDETVNLAATINNDRVGFEDVVYILQYLAQIRGSR